MNETDTGELIFHVHEWNTETEYPYCTVHGAMVRVSKSGLYRCLCCHIGWDRQTKTFLASSKEGFKKRKE